MWCNHLSVWQHSCFVLFLDIFLRQISCISIEIAKNATCAVLDFSVENKVTDHAYNHNYCYIIL